MMGVWVLSACSSTPLGAQPPPEPSASAPPSVALAPAAEPAPNRPAPNTPVADAGFRPCPGVGEFSRTGALESGKLEETSGLVVSRRHDVMWLHNDSGGKPRLYAVAKNGSKRGKVDVEGARAVDWEDIAWMKGEGHDWLLIGDVGDNRQRRERVQLYRVPEPRPEDDAVKAERMNVRYADGPQNVEVMVVDPRNDEIFLMNKNDDGKSTFYRVGPWRAGEEVTAMPVGSYAFPEGYSSAKPTAGDVGQGFLAIRTYSQIYLWSLAEDLPTTLAGPPCDVRTAREKQGEAMGFGFGGLVTVSEGEHAPVHFAEMGAP